jgi:hypothetical protein
MEVLLPAAMVENTFKTWAAAWGRKLGAQSVSRNDDFVRLRLWERGREYVITARVGEDERFLMPHHRITVEVKGPQPALKMVFPTAPQEMGFNEGCRHVMQKVRNVISLLYRERRRKQCKDSAHAVTSTQTSEKTTSAQNAEKPSSTPSAPN